MANRFIFGPGFYIVFCSGGGTYSDTKLVEGTQIRKGTKIRTLRGDWRNQYKTLAPFDFVSCCQLFEQQKSQNFGELMVW